MKIKIVNPVASDIWDEQQLNLLNAVKNPDTEIKWVNVKKGVTEIEQYYDETWAAPYTLEEMVKAEEEGFDAVLMPCFGDVALDAAKEALNIPVVGVCESSVHLAAMLGRKFSILATTEHGVKMMEDLVTKYGLISKLASIRTVDISPLGFTPGNKTKLKEALLKAAKKAMEDGADTLALGCGGMAIASWLQEQIGIPVIEPVIVGLKTAEALAKIHLSQSKKAFVKP